jgi:hypothetical protein
MAFSAESLLQLVMLTTWQCLCDTPFSLKSTLFTPFFPDEEALQSTMSILTFAPGLFEVLQAVKPPTIAFFKSLPTLTSPCWAVYLLVLEKLDCRPRIYIGSGTNTESGVKARFTNYDNTRFLPEYVEKSLEESYEIVHKGLLVWTPIPRPGLVPLSRLLFHALKATFAYIF